MAVNYLIVSDTTYKNVVLPDSVVQEFGLPITQEDEETGEVTPRTWTLEQCDAHGNPAGNAFPVQEDENGVPSREFEGEPTDWLFPLGSTGRNLIEFIDALAAAKPVDSNHVFLSIKQTHEYLADGSLPETLL